MAKRGDLTLCVYRDGAVCLYANFYSGRAWYLGTFGSWAGALKYAHIFDGPASVRVRAY